MRKYPVKFRAVFTAVLVGWCLLFLRCETTEKSMVRALYLAETDSGVTAALWYQAPEASADASEASAALQMSFATGETLEKSLYAAQKELPQTADYRLCDFLLIPADAPEQLLSEYERLVLEHGCGRTAARVVCADLSREELEKISEDEEGASDKLIGKLKETSARMPRLYQHTRTMLLSELKFTGDGFDLIENGFLRTPEQQIELDADETEMCLLLQGTAGKRTFWLKGEPVSVRRCSVSVTLCEGQAQLRLDCQLSAGEPRPTEQQSVQLETLSRQLTEKLWMQGIDLLSFQQRQMLQDGGKDELTPTKNACPNIQADVRFLML